MVPVEPKELQRALPNTFFPTVRLISIIDPQIEGKFTAFPGGLTSVFYGCID
jgi:hypothetical protein